MSPPHTSAKRKLIENLERIRKVKKAKTGQVELEQVSRASLREPILDDSDSPGTSAPFAASPPSAISNNASPSPRSATYNVPPHNQQRSNFIEIDSGDEQNNTPLPVNFADLKHMDFVNRISRAIQNGDTVLMIGNILSKRKLVLDYSTAELDVITFVNAENIKLGNIHKALVTNYSGHLKKLLSDPAPNENNSGTFTVESVEVDTFGHYINWVYDSFKKIAASQASTVELAKLYIFAIRYNIDYLAQDVLVYLFNRFFHEIEAPVPGQDLELAEFMKLAFSLGPRTKLAQLAVGRMLKLTANAKKVKEWYPFFPTQMKRSYDWKLLEMLERSEGGVLNPPPFLLSTYLLESDRSEP